MERTFDAAGPVDAIVRVPAGDIVVRTSERSTAHVVVEGERDPGEVKIAIDPLPDGRQRLLVEYRPKKAFGFLSFGRGLDVALELPTGSSLECEAGSADIEARGELSSLTVRNGSGDLRFDDVTGRVEAKTASGDVAGRRVVGRMAAHTASGDISVSELGSDVTVRTASGDVRLGTIEGSAQVSSVSGDVELGSLVRGKAHARSVSGDVIVGVAQGTAVYLDIGSTTGEVRSELEPAGTGDGVPDLEIVASTVSGDITVRRASGRA